MCVNVDVIQVPVNKQKSLSESDNDFSFEESSENDDLCLTSWDVDSPPQTVEEALEQFYLRKMKIDVKTIQGKSELNELLQTYFEGLQWNLWYYFRGPPSWSWFYKFYYSPYAISLVQYEPFTK